ncbi:MAG: UDP-2,3-diacylglucosamine diphosphatase LpxI [Elusimicrobia bacterium]|nr:UDP-2,3-diacylglucosamine diphosphatase LpxI [Elusimicrobiota bacterium]
MKLGLIAGSGRFPVLVADAARAKGIDVVALGIAGVTDPEVGQHVRRFEVFKLGQISKPLDLFKSEGITQAVMAGKVQHASVFGGILPDLRAMKLLARLKDKRTDTILAAIVEEFGKEGIEVLPSQTFLSDLLATAGPMTRRKPGPAESADIELGWRAAKALAGFDIGQSVVVREGAVVAVEAMEGTDACILRAAELSRSHGAKGGGLVVVKVAKPKQDFRYDLPVIGLGTLPVLEEAGVGAFAIEAGKTLIFDKAETLKKLDAAKIALVGLEAS